MTELKQKAKAELIVLLRDKKARADEIKYLLRAGKIKNFHEVSVIKKDIARILTLLKT